MEEVVNEIKDTKTKLAIAERESDITRRNTLESYLVELQRKENLLLQQQAAVQGNYLHPVNFIELYPSHILHICILFAFDEFHLMR